MDSVRNLEWILSFQIFNVKKVIQITKTLSELNSTLQTQGVRFEEIASTTRHQVEVVREVTTLTRNFNRIKSKVLKIIGKRVQLRSKSTLIARVF